MVRSCAIGALGHLKAMQEADIFVNALSDPSQEVRNSALSAVIKMSIPVPEEEDEIGSQGRRCRDGQNDLAPEGIAGWTARGVFRFARARQDGAQSQSARIMNPGWVAQGIEPPCKSPCVYAGARLRVRRLWMPVLPDGGGAVRGPRARALDVAALPDSSRDSCLSRMHPFLQERRARISPPWQA